MSKIFVVDNCIECPRLVQIRHYAEFDFTENFDWLCAAQTKMVVTDLDIFGELPDIPDWCPLDDMEAKNESG
ncbi:MAG: hypothetical protein E3J94_03075 [Desulfobacteraceae bacterium]|nr:MAG: hypothetical protein E3J94_03075 [Desulfobacteraceae bacterium]